MYIISYYINQELVFYLVGSNDFVNLLKVKLGSDSVAKLAKKFIPGLNDTQNTNYYNMC